MTPARLQTIEEIFHSAQEQSPSELDSFLEARCAGDALLRAELEALLAAHREATHFIETPTVDLAAKILHDSHAELLTGQRISHYELVRRIGSGGMGEVYLATDVSAGRQAALKLLPARFTGDPQRLERFACEAHAVVALNHPNILTIYEIGEDHSTYYIASELIDGETLRARLARAPITVEEAIDIASQIASALVAAHAAGIIHRDIKPENIMLRPDGYVKVLDFGIAKLAAAEMLPANSEQSALPLAATHVSSNFGTARYMSPEQVRGEEVDARTDLWSLGVVLYEMLARQAPFAGATAEEIRSAILADEPPKLEVSAELRRIITRTLRKKSEERYRSAREVNEALTTVRRKMESAAEPTGASAWLRGKRLAALACGVFVTVVGFGFYSQRAQAPHPPLEKSIAVLPFENLSDDKKDANFVVGVQDEIVTDLARITDLKVISRTSTRSYEAGQPRNSREIGRQLGVAHLLEGSVQRSANRLRINAQLIDARTDTHLWAQTYDREVADIFAIQTEIARTIATRLQSTISAREQAAIARVPTTDLVANELYHQAIALLERDPGVSDAQKVAELLERAIARDPSYLSAYCTLGRLHVDLYVNGERARSHLQIGEGYIKKAFQLRPDSSEAHLAQAYYLARGLRDYDDARAELELARRGLPNDPKVYYDTALLDYRQGRWSEALRNLERAIELDPRNVTFLWSGAENYSEAHHYPEAIQLCRRVLALSPRDKEMQLFLASQSLAERADLRPLHQEIDRILAEEPRAMADIWFTALDCAIFEHDPAAADRALAAIPAEGTHGLAGFVVPREWFVGQVASALNRKEAAQAAYGAARARLEKHLREQPDDGMSWALLGRTKALLGDKPGAIEAGERACQLWPLAREGRWGLTPLRQLTKIHAAIGDKDRALQLLSQYAREPSFISYGELKLDPAWDPLRGDPRFDKTVASLAPARTISK